MNCGPFFNGFLGVVPTPEFIGSQPFLGQFGDQGIDCGRMRIGRPVYFDFLKKKHFGSLFSSYPLEYLAEDLELVGKFGRAIVVGLVVVVE